MRGGPLVVVGDALLDRDILGKVTRQSPDGPAGCAAPILDEHTVQDRPGGAALAAVLAARDGAEVTLVTALGGGALLLADGDEPVLVPAPSAVDGAGTGAGDRFAVTALTVLANHALPEHAVRRAVAAATRFVAAGAAATVTSSPAGTDWFTPAAEAS